MLNGLADQLGTSFEELMGELRAIRKELKLIRGQLDAQALNGQTPHPSVARKPAGAKAKTTRTKRVST
jgi:hypothetical protein